MQPGTIKLFPEQKCSTEGYRDKLNTVWLILRSYVGPHETTHCLINKTAFHFTAHLYMNSRCNIYLFTLKRSVDKGIPSCATIYCGYFESSIYTVSLRAFLVCCQPLDPTPSEIKLQSAISAAVVQLLSAEGLIWKRNGFPKIHLRVRNLSIHSFHSTSTVLYLNNVYYILPHTWGESNPPPVDRFSRSQFLHLPSVWYYRAKRHNLLIKQNRLKLKEPAQAPWEFESCRISVNNLQTARKSDRVLFERQITVYKERGNNEY